MAGAQLITTYPRYEYLATWLCTSKTKKTDRQTEDAIATDDVRREREKKKKRERERLKGEINSALKVATR